MSAAAIKVAYLSDSFAKKERFGLSRYSHELQRQLRALGVEVVPTSPHNEFDGTWPGWLVESGFRQLPLKRRYLASLWSVSPLPWIEQWVPGIDVVHSIDVDYQVRARAPWVTTFHDLGPLTRPEFFSRARPWLLRNYVRAAVRRADALICVSQATAQELSDIAGVPLGDRLVVILEGAAPEFFEPPAPGALDGLRVRPAPGQPYFLYTGSMNPRKNLVRVVRAYAKVADRIPQKLVLTGAFGWDATELAQELERTPAAARIVRPGYVSDAQLRALYAGSDGFLFPSLYEGFGLPILEAMACGCPVVTSNLSSMPEVAGDAALLVDPASEDELAEAMLALAGDAALRARLVAAGHARARAPGFSWQACGASTLQVYRDVRRA
jgi:glycosyltransferase involved in cell wall biosynthesis